MADYERIIYVERIFRQVEMMTVNIFSSFDEVPTHVMYINFRSVKHYNNKLRPLVLAYADDVRDSNEGFAGF